MRFFSSIFAVFLFAGLPAEAGQAVASDTVSFARWGFRSEAIVQPNSFFGHPGFNQRLTSRIYRTLHPKSNRAGLLAPGLFAIGGFQLGSNIASMGRLAEEDEPRVKPLNDVPSGLRPGYEYGPPQGNDPANTLFASPFFVSRHPSLILAALDEMQERLSFQTFADFRAVTAPLSLSDEALDMLIPIQTVYGVAHPLAALCHVAFYMLQESLFGCPFELPVFELVRSTLRLYNRHRFRFSPTSGPLSLESLFSGTKSTSLEAGGFNLEFLVFLTEAIFHFPEPVRSSVGGFDAFNIGAHWIGIENDKALAEAIDIRQADAVLKFWLPLVNSEPPIALPLDVGWGLSKVLSGYVKFSDIQQRVSVGSPVTVLRLFEKNLQRELKAGTHGLAFTRFMGNWVFDPRLQRLPRPPNEIVMNPRRRLLPQWNLLPVTDSEGRGEQPRVDRWGRSPLRILQELAAA